MDSTPLLHTNLVFNINAYTKNSFLMLFYGPNIMKWEQWKVFPILMKVFSFISKYLEIRNLNFDPAQKVSTMNFDRNVAIRSSLMCKY